MAGQGGRRGTCRVLCVLLLGGFALVAAPAAAHAQIAVSDARAAEDTGAITFTITRQAGLLAPAATVSWATADGSAQTSADFAASSGTHTFAGTLLPGDQSVAVTVAVAGDGLDEAEESLRLQISGAEVIDGDGVGTIVDDDPVPSVAVADAPSTGEGGSAPFTVRLSRPSGRTVSVAYTTADGSGVAGTDYRAVSGRLTIAAGSRSAPVVVPLLDDGADEPNETFELRLSAPYALTLGDRAGSATIVDNDAPAAAPAPGSSSGGATGGSGQAPPLSGSGSGALPQLGVSRPRLRQPSTVLVTLACPRQSGSCSGRLTLFSRPSKRSKVKALRSERRLGRRSFALTAGGTQTLRLVLSRRDRSLLRRAGRMSVRAYVVTTDSAGRTGVRRVNGTLVKRTTHSG